MERSECFGSVEANLFYLGRLRAGRHDSGWIFSVDKGHVFDLG